MLASNLKRCRSFLSWHDRASKFMDVDFSFRRFLAGGSTASLAVIFLFTTSAGVQGASLRQPSIAKVDFNRDIRPIFSDICAACHGPDDNKRKAGLRLDLKESAFKPTKSGAVPIIPGDTKNSALLKRV